MTISRRLKLSGPGGISGVRTPSATCATCSKSWSAALAESPEATARRKPEPTAVRRVVDQIHPEVFDQFPGYCWGKVICWDLNNRRGLEEATLLLRDVEERVRQDESLAEIVAHPKIASWRQAFSQFGARPSKFQASIEALVRRARRGDALPPINPIVAIYNALSLRFLLPVGGDDLDLVSGGLHLRPATGDESYKPLGDEPEESPEAGEIIYADD